MSGKSGKQDYNFADFSRSLDLIGGGGGGLYTRTCAGLNSVKECLVTITAEIPLIRYNASICYIIKQLQKEIS